MRAVFTVDLSKRGDQYPTDEAIETSMDHLGRGFRSLGEMSPSDIRAIMMAQAESSAATSSLTSPVLPAAAAATMTKSSSTLADYDARRQHYRSLAQELFKEMPEVAAAELSAVIYTGYFQREQTLFVLTRVNTSELTFRLLHRELPRLQASTIRMTKDLLSSNIAGAALKSDQTEVKVYERKLDHVIIEGRVITHPGRETLRSNIKDTLLFLVPSLLFLPTAFILEHWTAFAGQADEAWQGHLERFSTAMLTTALVSALALLQTWIEIRRSKLIDWSVRGTK